MGNLLACCSTSRKVKQELPQRSGEPPPLPEPTLYGGCPSPLFMLKSTFGPARIGATHELRDDSGSLGSSYPEQASSFRIAGQKFCNAKKKVTFDPNVKTYQISPSCSARSGRKSEEEESCSQSKTGIRMYPSEHRYQNCWREAEEEDEDPSGDCYDDLDGTTDDAGRHREEEEEEEGESSGSLFSLQIEREEWQVIEEVSSSLDAKAASLPFERTLVDSPSRGARDRRSNNGARDVLRPVENLSQWRSRSQGGEASSLEGKISSNSSYETSNLQRCRCKALLL